ncbi:hypothetical protein CEN49_07810 [Fischerella thermalis CCMEE 5273]|nr:hypothetical protein CEN49_07810 [Fischerella thermalis CCMEE 5273]
MEIYKIQDDNVYLIYHPEETDVNVGSQYIIQERDETHKGKGIIVQVIANESLDYPGIIQELIQDSLEQTFRVKNQMSPLDREPSFTDVKSLKVAHAKIKKQIDVDSILNWEGWIPTRNVSIKLMTNRDVVHKIIGEDKQRFSLEICEYDNQKLSLNAEKLDMINVITGIKGSGKSHTAKNILLRLVKEGVPCVVFDLNNEYKFENALILKLGDNFKFDMAQMDPYDVFSIINSVFPLPDRTRERFQHTIFEAYNSRRRYCEKRKERFTIDLDFLKQDNTIENILLPGGKEPFLVNMRGSLKNALDIIANKGIFKDKYKDSSESVWDLKTAYKRVTEDGSIFLLFDLFGDNPKVRSILVESVNKQLINICDEQAKSGSNLYPFIFFEEAHMYIEKSAIENFATRGRHIGIRMFFMTNTPDALPEMIFRQLDNLFLLHLTHKSDIRHVSKSSFTDEETVENIATRMPHQHLMIIGSITNNYPLVVKGSALPDGTPETGVTRSLWEGLMKRNMTRDF